MKLLTTIASIALALAPLSVQALPLANISFVKGSSCAVSTGHDTWYSTLR